MIPFIAVIIGLSINLAACKRQEENVGLHDVKKLQEIHKDFYKIPMRIVEKPQEKPVAELPLKEQVDVSKVAFPDPYPYLREDKARSLRGQRHFHARKWSSLEKDDSLQDKKKQLWRIQDPDYQQWEPKTPQDKSTYPVDRSRILTTDMTIPGILVDAVNSQIPGRFRIKVDRDVLSPNGKYVLLPAYTTLMCGYESLERLGNSRLHVTCHRIIRPDGLSILLTSAKAADPMGRMGLVGVLDNRIWQRYGAAFVMASLSALSQGNAKLTNNPHANYAANTMAQTMSQVTAKILDHYVDLAPILTIAAGSRIHIVPENDLYFREPIIEIDEHKSQEFEPKDHAS